MKNITLYHASESESGGQELSYIPQEGTRRDKKGQEGKEGKKGRGTGTCPNLKKAKSKRVSTRGCRPAFVCIYGQGLARKKILPFQNYFVFLQSEIEHLTSSKMTPKRSVEHPRKTAK